MVRPSRRREMAKKGVTDRGVCIRVVCQAIRISESCYRYERKFDAENDEVANWLIRLTDNHRNWGFGLCYLYLRNVKNFKSKVYYNWEVNGQALFGLKDTLSMNFTGATSLKLTLRDDSGCMSSKTFILPVDTIYSLQQPSSLSHCGPDTLTLAATSTFSSNYWMGQYSVIDANGSTIHTVRDSIFKYYYKDPSQKYDNVTSTNGQMAAMIGTPAGFSYNNRDIYDNSRTVNDWGYIGDRKSVV